MNFGNLGRRCVRMKMTKHGRKCAEFGDVGDVGDFGDLGDFGDPGSGAIAGPLIGGGVAQVVTTAVKLIAKGKPISKWAAGIGLLVGGGLSGVLAFRRSSRATGIPALITAALVTVPRQIEDLLAPAGTFKGASERELYGLGEDDMDGAALTIMDSGSGSTGVFGTIVPEEQLGVTVPEEQMNDGDDGETNGAGRDVELLGGFGSNFMAVQ